jgi:hypothetical protein
MAKRSAAKQAASGTETNRDVEPMVTALAEQLGSFLGKVQKKADGWLENEALAAQVTQIRDRATELLKQVNRARAEAAKGRVASTKRQRRAGDKGGAVDAPVKRLRKPPPQELFDPRLGEPMGKQMGQKSLKRRGRG